MTTLDRYILARFLTNFVILFTLLFLFAVAIDLMVALDKLVEAARKIAGDDAPALSRFVTIVRLAVDFQGPRFFQFYAYLHGLVAIGAMAFTLAQMHRYRELVAMLSAGISMHRIAMPFVFGVFVLSAAQLVNQEVFLPRVAPLLLRDHRQIGEDTIDDFPVPFTPDQRGSLVQAAAFHPATGILSGLTVLERDERGRTFRRITADEARWVPGAAATAEEDDPAEGWSLSGGRAITLREADASAARAATWHPEQADFYATDVGPEVLLVRRYAQFASMLSLRQIGRMLDTPGVRDRDALRRHQYSRFSVVLLNVLVMWLTLPTFLLRQPANLVSRAVLCAAISLPAMIGATVFMVMDLPGIAPAVGVFLPVVILIPAVLAQWTYVRT